MVRHSRKGKLSMPDYKLINKRHAILKAALTRAIKSGDPERVKATVRAAVAEWNGPLWQGMWPDQWHRWNIAWQDAHGGWLSTAPDLNDL